MNTYWKCLLFILSLAAVTVWIAAFSFSTDSFKLITCDVGQGDAVLAVYGHIEILTDGGEPNGRVSECLSKYMPFWDRTIEAVINTHPQLDHYGGLIKVVRDYNVQYFIGNALENSSQEYQVLEKELGSRVVEVLNPVNGLSIKAGMIHYDIFWPSFAFQASEGKPSGDGKLGIFNSKRDPNEFSVQAILSFGNFRALLTGDIGEDMEDSVVAEIPVNSVNYIKIPHHGSRNGLYEKYIDLLRPEIAVVSVGAKNRYGLPNDEVIKYLNDKKIQTYRTDIYGDIILVSDGREYWIK